MSTLLKVSQVKPLRGEVLLAAGPIALWEVSVAMGLGSPDVV